MADIAYRPAGPEDLETVARLLTETSRGKPYFFGELDQWKLIGMSSFWKFTMPSSCLALLDGEPVGVLLVCADEEVHEAFAFYWGVLEKAQGKGIGSGLFREVLGWLRAAGYPKLLADTTFGSPHELLARLGAERTAETLELYGEKVIEGAAGYTVKVLDIDALDSWYREPVDPHWVQRKRFLRSNVHHLTPLGVYRGGRRCGFLMLSNFGVIPAVLGMQAESAEAAAAMFAWLNTNRYFPPYTVQLIAADSPEHHALLSLGFTHRHTSHSIVWKLS